MQTLYVELGDARYPIRIGPGLLGSAAPLADPLIGRDLLVVSNTTVAPLYLQGLEAALPDRRIATCILPDGERHKTLATAALVFDALVAHRCNRDAVILALGGGVVGDIAGFAAACYQRGIDFVQIPTTLLAQVDSSVGGKTGVNHPGGWRACRIANCARAWPKSSSTAASATRSCSRGSRPTSRACSRGSRTP